VIIFGDRPGMQNTKIYMNEKDLYSILATGSIDLWPKGPDYHDVRPEQGWPLMARIGKKNWYFSPLSGCYCNAFTQNSHYSGYLYLGVRDGKVDRYGNPSYPNYCRDNIGSFSVDIIVWKTDDYVQIADLLEKMKEKDPKNRAIVQAFNDATYKRNLFLAAAKASKEIEQTKKEIRELREESQREKETITKSVEKKEPSLGTKPVAPELSKDKKIAELEAKLTALTQTLKELDEMKKQLQEEKEKTSHLSKELSEKEMTKRRH
jgi:hypothetical protein